MFFFGIPTTRFNLNSKVVEKVYPKRPMGNKAPKMRPVGPRILFYKYRL